MNLSDFDFDLPEALIATRPARPRSAARLLVADGHGLRDLFVRDLVDQFRAGDRLILNNTRVIPARLFGTRQRLDAVAKVEVTLLEPLAQGWRALAKPLRKVQVGEVIRFSDDLSATVAQKSETDLTLAFNLTGPDFDAALQAAGQMPLPPYIAAKRPADAQDNDDYQTVFARHLGAVAAPTASLHFTPELLAALADKGVARTSLTLHVGAGTFLPVKSDRMADHDMHREQLRIPLATLRTLLAHLDKGPVVAVGTTAMRTLESIYWHGVALIRGTAGEEIDVHQWQPYEQPQEALPDVREALRAVIEQVTGMPDQQLVGGTRLLIAPGYRFRFATGLITNFHQPQSTLLLLVAAFIGEHWRRVYQHALDRGYRFLSYGDGSLLWRQGH